MADDSLVEQILTAAGERGEQALRDAQAGFDERFERGLSELERAADERREVEYRQADDRLRQRLSGARLEQSKQLVSLRRKLIDELYSDAWERLSSGDAYHSYLSVQLREHAERGDELIVSQRESEQFASEFKGLLEEYGVTLAEEQGRFRSGFVIARGDARLNCTLDQFFGQLQEETEIEVAQFLFGSD